MLKQTLITVLAATLSLGCMCAAQTGGKVVLPLPKTAASDGKQMFASYCAPCHGVDGRGHGPVAPALKIQPTDLTLLRGNNHGKFPDAHIISLLQFGVDVPSHGTAQMPVWGPILGNMNRENAQERQLRISNISYFLKSIQAP